MSDILYESLDDIEVKAASIDKLIIHCIEKFKNSPDEKVESGFVNVFFLTYHWYITTEELLQRFIDIYWLDNFGCNFEANTNALALLSVINEQVDVNGFSLTLNLDNWNVSKRSNKVRLESDKRRESLNFNDMPAEEIADQLLYLNWKNLKKIPVYEWLKYGKSAKTSESPLLKDHIGLFNDISKYVMAMILMRLDAQSRARAIDKFVKLSKRLLALNDFNTLLAVVGGLGHSTINRLHKTKELLSNENKLFIKEAHDLLSSNYNYSCYRNKVDQISGFVVPIFPFFELARVIEDSTVTFKSDVQELKTYKSIALSRDQTGVIMKDLIAIDVSYPDYIEHEGSKLIHFHKMVKIAGTLEQILRSRKLTPTVSPKKEIFNVMRVSLRSRYSEEDLYQMSLEREPRITSVSLSGSIKTPGPTENPVFADWAQGLTQETPSREIVEKYVKNMVDAVFKTYDFDGNGAISKDEFDALASNFPFIDSFAVLDVNGDGSISRQEMLNYFMNANSQEMTKEFLHDFQENSFYSPTYCVYCMGFLWGIGKSGYRCKTCQISCHKDCRNHVVMECRPNRTYSMRTGSLEKSEKAQRKRMKLVDQDWHGSTDSQLSCSDNEFCHSPSIQRGGSSLMNDSAFHSSIDITDSYVGRLKERIARLEQEKNTMRKENHLLKSKLSSAESEVTTLKSQLTLVRQQSVRFMLEQMERMNTCTETDV